jgi:hypothetical protein
MPIGFIGAIPMATEQDALQVESKIWKQKTEHRRVWAEAHGLRTASEALDYDDAFELSGQHSWYEWVTTGAYDNPMRTYSSVRQVS